MMNHGKSDIKSPDTDTSSQKNIGHVQEASRAEWLQCNLILLILCQMTALHGREILTFQV
jgi:hypothetical protein